MLIQQGDVLLKEAEHIPNNWTKLETNIIHKGLNHIHAIEGDFQIYDHQGTIYIRANSECLLNHDEHGKADRILRTLPKGTYIKSIVKEYDHWLEESKEVVD